MGATGLPGVPGRDGLTGVVGATGLGIIGKVVWSTISLDNYNHYIKALQIFSLSLKIRTFKFYSNLLAYSSHVIIYKIYR